jgi:ABC-type multidrug transport system permease subunit
MTVVDATNTGAARALRIPSDFTERVLRGEKTRVELEKKQGAGEADGALVDLRMVRALVAVNSHLLEAATKNGRLDKLSEAQLRAIREAPNPVKLKAHFAGRKPVPSGFNFSLPGNLVTYLMMNVVVFGGAAMAAGRRSGTIKRLCLSPATRLEIVIGKVYGNTLLGTVQIVYFLLLGKFVFHVNLGANLPGVLLILLTLAWAAGGLAVLVGSITSAEDRVIAICVLATLLMGALGGCWWPLEIAPPFFQRLALCLPTGWALAGLNQLISFGSGFEAALAPVAALLAFGIVTNILAIRFFRA